MSRRLQPYLRGSQTGRFQGKSADFIIADESNTIKEYTLKDYSIIGIDFGRIEKQVMAYYSDWLNWQRPVDPNNMFAQFMQKIVDKH